MTSLLLLVRSSDSSVSYSMVSWQERERGAAFSPKELNYTRRRHGCPDVLRPRGKACGVKHDGTHQAELDIQAAASGTSSMQEYETVATICIYHLILAECTKVKLRPWKDAVIPWSVRVDASSILPTILWLSWNQSSIRKLNPIAYSPCFEHSEP